MSDWDRERWRLEQWLGYLVGRVNELEARIAELEETKTADSKSAEASAGRATAAQERAQGPVPPMAQVQPAFKVQPAPQVQPPHPGPAAPGPAAPVPAPAASAAASAPTPAAPVPAPAPARPDVATPRTPPAPVAQNPWQGVKWSDGRPWQPPSQPTSGVRPPSTPATPVERASGAQPAGPGPRPQAGWAGYRPTIAEAAKPASGAGKPPFDIGRFMSSTSWRDLESRLTGRVLAWVGGAAVLLGVVFFLSLAFSRGWIGPEGRVALGVLGGSVLMTAGGVLFDRRQASLGRVLTAVGLGVVSLSLFSGTRLYNLYGPEWALAGSFAAAVGAAVIAIRANSEALAIFGLLAIAAAPPIMGAQPNLVTIGFLAATVVGTTLIALWRSWRWLPPAAFVITAPQLAFWLVAKPEPAMAIPAIAAFWALNAVAASADDMRAGGPNAAAPKAAAPSAAAPNAAAPNAAAPEPAGQPSVDDIAGSRSESLFLANSLVAVLGGLWVLTDAYLSWQGAFLAGLAVAHFAVGAFFVRRRGGVYPFGLLANAIGVVVVAVAIERQWDGILVPIGWAIEGVALAFFYGRRKNDYAGVAAAIIGGLQILHLLVYEYPWLSFRVEGNASTAILPFANLPGVALAGVVLAAVVAGSMVSNARAQAAITAVGALFFAYSLPFQLTGPALVLAWAVEGAGLLGFWRTRRFDYLAALGIPIASLAVLHLLVFEFPLWKWTLEGTWGPGQVPFADESSLALGALLAAAVLGGWLSRNRDVRYSLFAAGALLVAYALPFELRGAALVAGWSAVAVGVIATWRLRRLDETGVLSLGVASLAVLHLLVFEFPLWKWTLEGTWGPGQVPFADESSLALGALLAAAVLGGWLSRNRDVRYSLFAAGALLVAYALPFELRGAALVAGWSAVAVGVIATWRLRRLDETGVLSLGVASLAVLHLLVFEFPLWKWTLEGTWGPGQVPFADESSLALGALLAAAVLGGWLSRNRDVRYGLLLVATLLVAYALPFELTGPALVVAWCLAFVALAAIWGWRRHGSPAAAAAAPVLLALANFVVYQMPLDQWRLSGGIAPATPPFADAPGLCVAILLVAFIAAAALTRSQSVACVAATGSLLLVAYALPYELSGAALVGGWAALIPASVLVDRLLDRLPGVPESRARLARVPTIESSQMRWQDSPLVAQLLAGALAVGHFFMFDLPWPADGLLHVPATPFVDGASLAAALVAGCLLLAAALTLRADLRVLAVLLAVLIAATVSVFELALPYAVAIWASLAIAICLGLRFVHYGRGAYLTALATLTAAGLWVFLSLVDPPERLGVVAAVARTGVWFAVDSTVSAGLLALVGLAVAWQSWPPRAVRVSLRLASGVLLVYLASTIVVDFFQGQVGGRFALEELQKQAQVGVSITWGSIGMAVFLIGVIRWRAGVRESGLALLGLATAKVFVFDLSYLDVAYRVLSLIGFGVLLLLGAFVYQSLARGRQEPAGEPPTGGS